ncbi:hypothetical protein Poli38472_014269 [Pythium oligandrum]|uniref:Uncharacterized protein n=1 Tax=Pythium oligandrum TaxID=41045 RepID=A0A8K1CKX2_PYTOL|nr:hypothetical protein Poli38472_014269 [Pythium oligandrum]|eukprot:TMW64152.1 hypothetical protein Poli38472_014269 [Pythium oligandrum]
MDTELLDLFQQQPDDDDFQDLLDEFSSSSDDAFAAALTPEDKLATLELPGRNANLNGKERNRLIVKRYYYRKITTLKDLKAEVDRLETRYQQLLQEEHLATIRPSSEDDAAPKSALEKRLAAFKELALLADALRRENERLQRSQDDFERLQKQLTQLYVAQCKSAERTHAVMELKKQNPTIDVRQVTSLECAEITTDSYLRITAFRSSTENFSTGASVFGWRDRHRYENKNLSFSLEKTFRHHTFESVSDKLWQLVKYGDTFGQLYPPSLHSTFHEIQRLDENNVVYFHTLQVGQKSDFRTKTVVLCTRLSVMDGDGCLLVFRSLDPFKYVRSEGDNDQKQDRRGRQKIEQQVEEKWVGMFVWVLFSRAGLEGEHCVTEFGGTLFETPMLASSWWMIERLHSTVHAEQLLVGPTNVLMQS